MHRLREVCASKGCPRPEVLTVELDNTRNHVLRALDQDHPAVCCRLESGISLCQRLGYGANSLWLWFLCFALLFFYCIMIWAHWSCRASTDYRSCGLSQGLPQDIT